MVSSATAVMDMSIGRFKGILIGKVSGFEIL